MGRAKSQGLIELGERIRIQRKKSHMSQEDFAERVGINAITVSRIEGGQMAMSVETFARMVQVLDIDAGALLGERILGPTEKNPLEKMLFRILHLPKNEQQIVIQTIGALVDGFYKYRE